MHANDNDETRDLGGNAAEGAEDKGNSLRCGSELDADGSADEETGGGDDRAGTALKEPLETARGEATTQHAAEAVAILTGAVHGGARSNEDVEEDSGTVCEGGRGERR